MEGPSPRWKVAQGGIVLSLEEAALRAKLRDGSLSGLERARREDGLEWAPIHTLPLFREEIPVSSDPKAEAEDRLIRGWLRHLLIFAGVCGALTWGAGHFPVCGVWWAIPLGFHSLRVLPALSARLGRGAAPVTPAVAALSPLASSLNAALEALPPELALDRAALRRDAAALEQQIAALRPLADPAARAALAEEAEDLATRLAAAPDARTAEALSHAAEALAARRALAAEAALALARLEARAAALRHQVAAIQLAAIQRRSPPREAIEGLTDALQAEAEVAQALARAAASRSGPERSRSG